jgi:superfamily II helicase
MKEKMKKVNEKCISERTNMCIRDMLMKIHAVDLGSGCGQDTSSHDGEKSSLSGHVAVISVNGWLVGRCEKEGETVECPPKVRERLGDVKIYNYDTDTAEIQENKSAVDLKTDMQRCCKRALAEDNTAYSS